MTLKKKTLIILLITYASLILVLSTFYWVNLVNMVSELEQRSIKLYSKQFITIFKDEISSLAPVVGDWASWDDAYNYALGKYPDFVEENFMDNTFNTLKISLIVVLNKEAEMIYSKMLDEELQKEISIPDEVKEALAKNSTLFNLKTLKSTSSGLIVVDNTLFVITVRRLTDSSIELSQGEAGYIVMGRFITKDIMNSIRDKSGADLKTILLNSPNIPENIKKVETEVIKSNELFIKEVNEHVISAYTIFKDINNKPITLFQISIPRDIYQKNKSSFYVFILYLTVFSFVFGIVTYLLFEIFILKRFKQVNEIANKFETSLDKLPDVNLSGKDELAELAKSVNNMFRTIDKYRDQETKVKDNLKDLVKAQTSALEDSLSRLKLTNMQLEEANSHKVNFLSSMSHELRTPLNAVIGFSDLLIKKIYGDLNNKQVEYAELINDSGKHLLSLINDCLYISKIDAGRMELELLAFSQEDLFNSVVDMFKPQCIKRGISLVLELDETENKVYGDFLRCKQILINLVSNALKYSPENTQIIIKTEVTTEDKIRVFVIDQGIGIDEDKIDKIFDEFYQADLERDKKLGGMGLGLALTKRMVEMHGGKIGVNSKKDHGTTIWFTLPLAYEGFEKTKFEKIDIKSIKDVVREKRILIAEDNDTNRALIIDILNVYEHNVVIAKNGKEAIDLAFSHSPELIIMDVQMPDMTGIEVVKVLRENSKFLKLPIVALTGRSDRESRKRHIESGFTDQIDKPFSSAEMIYMINKYLKSE